MSPPPLPKHSCIFVNDILYQNVMFGQGGGEGCQKKKKTNQNR